MGIFDRVQLADTPYIQQYQGLPLAEVNELGTVMQGRYDAANEQYDRLNTAASNMQVLSEDDPIKQAQIEDIRKVIDMASERGDAWEEMLPALRQKARAFTSNQQLRQAQENLQRKQQWQSELLERRNKGEITDEFYRDAIMQSKFKGTLINPDDDDYIEGGPNLRTFSGYNPVNFFDVGKFSNDFITNYKSDAYAGPLKPSYDSNGLVEYYMTANNERVEKDEVMAGLTRALVSNGQAMDYLKEYSRISGKPINNVIATALDPYAEKAAFSKTKATYMKGEAGRYRAGKKLKEEENLGTQYQQTTTSPFKRGTIDVNNWDLTNAPISTARSVELPMMSGDLGNTPSVEELLKRQDETNAKRLSTGATPLERFISYQREANPEVAKELENIVSSNPKTPDMSETQYTEHVQDIYNQRVTQLSNFEGMFNEYSLDMKEKQTERLIGKRTGDGRVTPGQAVLGGSFYFTDQSGKKAEGLTFQNMLKDLGMTSEEFTANASIMGESKENPYTGADGYTIAVTTKDGPKQVILGTSTVEKAPKWRAFKTLIQPKYDATSWTSPQVKIPINGKLYDVETEAVEKWQTPDGTQVDVRKGSRIPTGSVFLGRDAIVRVLEKDEKGNVINTIEEAINPGTGKNELITTENIYNILKNQ